MIIKSKIKGLNEWLFIEDIPDTYLPDILPGILFKLSAGTGFKTPDLKNRYQVFVNPLSNYMVIGTEILHETLQRMQRAGEISEIRQYVLSQLGSRLRPERSISLNAGLQWKPEERLKIEAGVYYHHIRDQINSVQVATGTGNRQIFTYQYLPRSANKGVEASLTWQVLPGLENRSRHMANLRFFYSWKKAGLNFSFRSSYRSRYAFGDANNNYFIDRYDDFVDGYFLLNATIEKRLLRDRLRIRVTADNILGYTDRLMPAQPGRIVLAGIGYDLL